jgi:putative DNA primase/helicase
MVLGLLQHVINPYRGTDCTQPRHHFPRLGFRKIDSEGDTTYYILPESWKSEICAGLNPGFVARVLADHGMLRKGPGDKLTRSERLPGSPGTTRCYVIMSRILGASDDER